MASLKNVFVREYSTLEFNFAEVVYSEKKMWVEEKGEGWKKSTKVDLESEKAHELSEEEVEEKRLESVACSIRRAKKELKFLVLNNVLSSWRFVTLTYAGKGQFDRQLFSRDVAAMIRRLESHLKRQVSYICAFEWHPEGHGYHAHLLIDCPYYKNEVFQELFWKCGFVRLTKVQFRKSPRCILKAAKYMMKYVSKDAEKSGKGCKRYSASRDLIREPYRTAYGASGSAEVKKLVNGLKSRGYSYVEDYSMVVDGELVRVAFYFKAKPTKKIANKTEKLVNQLQNLFIGELVA